MMYYYQVTDDVMSYCVEILKLYISKEVLTGVNKY